MPLSAITANDPDPRLLAIAPTKTACDEIYCVLKKDNFLIRFYGWNCVDCFVTTWQMWDSALPATCIYQNLPSESSYADYRYECALALAEDSPALPPNQIPYVLNCNYGSNCHYMSDVAWSLLFYGSSCTLFRFAVSNVPCGLRQMPCLYYSRAATDAREA